MREKLFEEKDIMMVYLRRGRIPILESLSSSYDRNSRTSSIEERGIDVGRKTR